MRAEISALRTKRSKLSGKKNVKARKKIGRRIKELEEALDVAEKQREAHEENDEEEEEVALVTDLFGGDLVEGGDDETASACLPALVPF